MQCLCRGKKVGEASSIYIFYNVCARPLACFVCNSQFCWKNFFYCSGSNYSSRIEFFALTGPSYVHVSSVLWISWRNWEDWSLFGLIFSMYQYFQDGLTWFLWSAGFSNKFPIWLNQLAVFMCEKIMKWKAQFSDKSLRAFLVEDLLFVWCADWSRLKKWLAQSLLFYLLYFTDLIPLRMVEYMYAFVLSIEWRYFYLFLPEIIILILTRFPYSLIISILFIFFGYYFLFSGYWGYNSLCRVAFYCGRIKHRRSADQVLYFWPVLHFCK